MSKLINLNNGYSGSDINSKYKEDVLCQWKSIKKKNLSLLKDIINKACF